MKARELKVNKNIQMEALNQLNLNRTKGEGKTIAYFLSFLLN